MSKMHFNEIERNRFRQRPAPADWSIVKNNRNTEIKSVREKIPFPNIFTVCFFWYVYACIVRAGAMAQNSSEHSSQSEWQYKETEVWQLMRDILFS